MPLTPSLLLSTLQPVPGDEEFVIRNIREDLQVSPDGRSVVSVDATRTVDGAEEGAGFVLLHAEGQWSAVARTGRTLLDGLEIAVEGVAVVGFFGEGAMILRFTARWPNEGESRTALIFRSNAGVISTILRTGDPYRYSAAALEYVTFLGVESRGDRASLVLHSVVRETGDDRSSSAMIESWNGTEWRYHARTTVPLLDSAVVPQAFEGAWVYGGGAIFEADRSNEGWPQIIGGSNGSDAGVIAAASLPPEGLPGAATHGGRVLATRSDDWLGSALVAVRAQLGPRNGTTVPQAQLYYGSPGPGGYMRAVAREYETVPDGNADWWIEAFEPGVLFRDEVVLSLRFRFESMPQFTPAVGVIRIEPDWLRVKVQRIFTGERAPESADLLMHQLGLVCAGSNEQGNITVVWARVSTQQWPYFQNGNVEPPDLQPPGLYAWRINNGEIRGIRVAGPGDAIADEQVTIQQTTQPALRPGGQPWLGNAGYLVFPAVLSDGRQALLATTVA